MSKVCISTVVSDDTFQYYMPLFIYTAKRAYHQYYVKIFLNGQINSKVKAALDLIPYDGWEIVENAFDFKVSGPGHNAMRFLLGPEHFEGFDFLYITDVDFLIFAHKPTLKTRYEMLRDENPYVAARVSFRAITRKGITRRWTRKFKRLAGGRVWLKLPEWFEKTKKAREYYLNIARRRDHDDVDKHDFGSYREYDEVMLVRLCRKSKIPTSKKPGTTPSGERIGGLYRDIHLGDLKFRRRAHSMRKMTNRIEMENIENYVQLEKDKTWQEIKLRCCASGTIRQVLRRLRKHVDKRI